MFSQNSYSIQTPARLSLDTDCSLRTLRPCDYPGCNFRVVIQNLYKCLSLEIQVGVESLENPSTRYHLDTLRVCPNPGCGSLIHHFSASCSGLMLHQSKPNLLAPNYVALTEDSQIYCKYSMNFQSTCLNPGAYTQFYISIQIFLWCLCCSVFH